MKNTPTFAPQPLPLPSWAAHGVLAFYLLTLDGRTYTLSDWYNVTKRQNKQTKIPTSKVKECINNRMRRSTFDCFTIKIFIKIGFMCAGEESEFISNNRRQCRTMSSPFCFLTYKNFPSPGWSLQFIWLLFYLSFGRQSEKTSRTWHSLIVWLHFTPCCNSGNFVQFLHRVRRNFYDLTEMWQCPSSSFLSSLLLHLLMSRFKQ